MTKCSRVRGTIVRPKRRNASTSRPTITHSVPLLHTAFTRSNGYSVRALQSNNRTRPATLRPTAATSALLTYERSHVSGCTAGAVSDPRPLARRQLSHELTGVGVRRVDSQDLIEVSRSTGAIALADRGKSRGKAERHALFVAERLLDPLARAGRILHVSARRRDHEVVLGAPFPQLDRADGRRQRRVVLVHAVQDKGVRVEKLRVVRVVAQPG